MYLSGCLLLLSRISVVGLTPGTNAMTAFLQEPPKRRSSLRASPETPVTIPLTASLAAFIIDETFVDLRLPSSLLGSVNLISHIPRKLQLLPACYCSHTASCLCSVFSWFKVDSTLSDYSPRLMGQNHSMLSISSHQAISRALSQNISSDQIYWKGMFSFRSGSMLEFVWECAAFTSNSMTKISGNKQGLPIQHGFGWC